MKPNKFDELKLIQLLHYLCNCSFSVNFDIKRALRADSSYFIPQDSIVESITARRSEVMFSKVALFIFITFFLVHDAGEYQIDLGKCIFICTFSRYDTCD